MIKEIQFIGKKAYQLENEHLKTVVIPSEGANLISLYDKKKELEIFRTPKTLEEYETRKMTFGTPVLFPPNRIEDAKFTFDGRKYQLEMNRAKENNHIHGFVHNKEWKIKEIDEKENRIFLQLRSIEHGNIVKQFPHEFVMEMLIVLTDTGIEQSLSIQNKSDNKMPLGIGYHTTFFFDQSDSILKMEIGDQWELGKRGLPTGEFIQSLYQEKLREGMLLKDIRLDDVYQMTKMKKAIIEHKKEKIKVMYEVDEKFCHWVLFTGDGESDFVAIEPYSWVTNAPNLTLPKEVTGMDELLPGEEKQYVTKIKVEEI
jgi:aldose 1-epimerase